MNLDNLPKDFTEEDKEFLQLLIDLGSDSFPELTWLIFLTDNETIFKVKRMTKWSLSLVKNELNSQDVMREVKKLNHQIIESIDIYTALERQPSVKVLNKVTDEMVRTLAEFSLAREKHMTYLESI